MVVVPEGDGTGLFEVWTGDCEEPYTVDLAGGHDRCSCPDMEFNLEDGQRCKHVRRVRMEFGLPPFEDVPSIRSEHAAPMDVELARQRRGIDVEPEPEIDETASVEKQAAQAVRVMADGGTDTDDIVTDGGRDGQEKRLKANEIACDLMDIDGAGEDFEAFCGLVRVVQDGIIRVWDHEERRQERRRIERERREYDRMNAPREVPRQH
jgi:hypothetical protein